MEYFLCVLGMVFIVEGLPYIAFPGKMKDYMRRIQLIPDKTLQMIGILLAISGVALIYICRHVLG